MNIVNQKLKTNFIVNLNHFWLMFQNCFRLLLGYYLKPKHYQQRAVWELKLEVFVAEVPKQTGIQ